MIATALVARIEYLRMDDAAPAVSTPHFADSIPTDAESSFELVIRARAGDQAALDELFTRYRPRLRVWAHGRLPQAARGAHETQDLVQDTLTKVFRRIKTFEPRHPGAFREYVWTTMWNSIRDIARTYQRRGATDPLDEELPGYLPSPLEEAMGREALERYERALERLRPVEREAIIARIEMGLSYHDVAATLGKPTVSAAHVAVSRALMRLAEEMAYERRAQR
jgi:RNA polymerase sigma-70 factor (ECF subfamily)